MATQPATRPPRRRFENARPMPGPLGPRALRVGMRTTLLAPLAAAASVGLANETGTRLGAFGAVFVLVAIGAALATLLPWGRLIAGARGMRLLVGWAVLNVLVVSVAGWATETEGSSLLLMYAVLVVFFAAAFPPREQTGLLVLTIVGYSTVLALSGWDPLPPVLLATVGLLAGFLARDLRARVAAHRDAQVRSERRWKVAAAVAATARDLNEADPRSVLQGVVDAIVSLGFDTARIYARRGENEVDVVLPTGVARGFTRGLLSLPAPIRTEPLEHGRDVIVRAETGDPDTAEILRAVGLATVCGTPLVVGERPEGVLIVGSARAGVISPADVEGFGMFAAQAALAVGNAFRVEERRAVEARLSDADRVRDGFLSSVSAELRAPLAVVTETGASLRRGWEDLDDGARRGLLERLGTSAALLDTSVGALLDRALLEAGRLEPTRREVDLGQIVDGVLERLAGLLDGHEMRLDVQQGLAVEADPDLIGRVVEILVSNAAKHTPPGSWIEVSVHRNAGHRVVRVADGGPGIRTERLRTLLGPSAGNGGAPSDGGLGIGLPLAVRLLRLCGSELEVRSEPGHGSRFWFRLPRVGAAAAAAAAGPSAQAEGLRQLSLDELLLPSAAADAAGTPPPPPVDEPEPERASKRYGAAAVAAIAATSSLAVAGVVPEQAREAASTVLALIGYSTPANVAETVADAVGGRDRPRDGKDGSDRSGSDGVGGSGKGGGGGGSSSTGSSETTAGSGGTSSTSGGSTTSGGTGGDATGGDTTSGGSTGDSGGTRRASPATRRDTREIPASRATRPVTTSTSRRRPRRRPERRGGPDGSGSYAHQDRAQVTSARAFCPATLGWK